MFGHQDENNEDQTTPADTTGSVVVDGNPVPADDSVTDTTTDTPAVEAPPEDAGTSDESVNETEEPTTAPATPEETPAAEPESAPETPEPTIETDDDKTEDTDSAPADTAPVNDELLSIKQEALTQLSPLVDHLDQTPEEKFHTTMMMIQAADNQSLIQSAFAAAKQITDDKVRAQALLDIINEINYFTQNQTTK